MTIKPIDLDDFDDDAPRPVKPGSLSARALAQGEPPYLKGLNPEQRAAVETTDGPLLVLAGAGTGKTRVLTTRLAHILATGKAWPGQILAVTFTNKAAREMKDRIGALIGGVVEGMTWLGTFHSIGVKILRNHAELAGLKSGFSILDTDDQIRLLKQLLEAHDIDEKRWPARQLASLIDGWKNRGLTPDKVPAGEAHGFANGLGGKLYAEYQQRLKVVNAADFGDLLLEVLRIFQEHPDVLKEYQRRFNYMLVDEYQDTNVAQYLWLRLLAQGHRNICCVGDDDQSIYGWRGAEVDNILRFEKDFPGAKVIRLERNYRSTPHILGAASGLIAKNESRLGKTLRTDREEGEPVTVRVALGRRRGSPRHRRGHREPPAQGRDASTTWRSWCAPPSRCAPSRTASSRWACPTAWSAARASTSAPKSATRWPISRSSPRPTMTSPSSASSTRPSAASATLRSSACMSMPATQGISLYRAAEALSLTDELPAKTRTALRDADRKLRRAGARRWTACRTRSSPKSFWTSSATPTMWQNDKSPEAAGPAREPQGTRALHGRIREPAGLPRAHLAGHGRRAVGRATTRSTS